MNLKLNKRKKVIIFLILFSFIFSSILFINLLPKNQIIIDNNLFNEEITNNLNIAAAVGSDWELGRDIGQIATINKPSKTQDGDLLILHCTIDGQADSMTGPIGWNVLLPENNSVDPTTASWYKIAGDSEPINYTITWGTNERYVAGVIRITGYDKTNPIQATTTATGTGSIVNPSVYTTNNYTLIIGFHGLDREGPGDNYSSTFLETGPTVLYARTAGGGNQGCSVGLYYEIQTNQGISPSRIWSTGGSEDWYAATIAINLNLPLIDITSPLENETYGVISPNFTVEIMNSNLDKMWYTLDGGLNNYSFTENSTINQAAWGALPDGVVTIRFYSNNSLGDINFQQVNIIKDSSAPVVSIISPIENEIFGVISLNFTVEIMDSNLNTTWYTVDGGFNNYTFTENGTILQAAWDSLPDGIVTLRFYANNSLGNINFEEVKVIKDTSTPIISIISPVVNGTFGANAPNFTVEIADSNLNVTWYTVDGGLNNYTFTENGTILQAAWNSLLDGIVTIRFYANDSLGNVNFEEVNVIKDNSAPTVNIVSPVVNGTFGVNAPNFIVEFIDTNLNVTWYTVDGGFNNYTFTENGTIHQGAWDSLPNGIVIIRIYANDSLGNINFEEVNVIKDSSAPIISIISPVLDAMFGVTAPNFTVEVIDTNLNVTWYTVDGGFNNYTFTENGTIHQAAWDSRPDGIVTIRIYANDSLGNINFEEVNVVKDSTVPNISIISPIVDKAFGVNALNFTVEIADSNLNVTWYTVDGGLNNYTFTENGTIHQAAWDSLPDGIVTIRFYANDTLGNFNFQQVNIFKDSSAPIISIISPIMDKAFGVNAPNFIVEISDTNLNTTWYTVDGGLNNYTFIENGTIHQAAWDSLPNGIIIIRIYANDSLGNINFEDVNIIKDGSAPVISIISPIMDEMFGVNTPNFTVEITDTNLNITWYTVDGGLNNYTFTENGTIHQAVWDSLLDGIVSIRFSANDTLENLNFQQVNIIKDSSAPIINIISPLLNYVFGVAAPNFTVEITDPNLNTTWYTMDGGFNNYTFTENGTIHQAAWDSLPDGIVTIRFYANDTVGNINFEEVNVTKDSSAPIVNIISPIIDTAFGGDAPNFTVEITDINLNTTWYTVDGGFNNYTFTENGTIHQAAWDSLPDGIVTIRFYANDTLGNLNFQQVNIIKDSSAPIINIISPLLNDVFGVAAPNFTVEITDINLNTTWYTVDGGFNNYTFTENGTIHQAAWDSLPDGIVTIRFYANDTLGNLNFQQVNIIKDSSAPIVSIISPSENKIFGVDAPSFIVEITDINLNTTWYTVDGGFNNYTFTENGTIHQAAWDVLSDGIVTIRFYANDSLGNVNFEEVNVIKDSSAPTVNIVSPVVNGTFGVNAPNFIFENTDPNLNTTWYTVDGGFNNFTFTENGTILQAAWNSLPDGIISIRFYANDSLGNINFEEVNVFKDGSAPNINIISPVVNGAFGVNAPNFTVEITDTNLDTMWYSLFNGTYVSQNRTFTVNGTIDSVEWGSLYDGTYTIRFYTNDTLGNLNFQQVNIIKDSSAPIISIISPIENEIFGVAAPNFTVEIIDSNLDKMWYSISNGTYVSQNRTFTVNGTIDSMEWGSLYDGAYTVRFYSNDSLGNINFEDVNVIKDGSAPIISITGPIENEIFGVATPNFTVEITDTNLDTMWYSLFNGTYVSQNRTFIVNGTIDPMEWDTLYDGVYAIRFCANNTLGNINFEVVNVIKDSSAPNINIVSPVVNGAFGVNAPNFIVEIADTNLNTMWYTVDGGFNNYTFTDNETIHQAAWDSLLDGIVSIRFYANDTLENINFEVVNVIKDNSAPNVSIISPVVNGAFGVDAPNFIVEITDPNLDTMWYTVNNSATKFIFTQDGVIDQTIWDAQTNGDVILIFYANDTIGNLASEVIIIRKSATSEPVPDMTTIIVLVSVIGGIIAVVVVLGILVKKGKISLKKLSIKKSSTEKIPTEKTLIEETQTEETQTEETQTEETQTEETRTEETSHE